MKLDTEKIYYLSHPLTSVGDPEENRQKEAAVFVNIMLQEQGEFFGINAADNCIKIIRPLAIIPKSYSEKKAAALYRKLLGICDAIIMAGDWEESQGCLDEYEIAVLEGKEIILAEDLLRLKERR